MWFFSGGYTFCTPLVLLNIRRIYLSVFSPLPVLIVVIHSVVSDSLWPRGLKHTCHSPSPGVCSNSFTYIESVMPSNYFVLCHPHLFLPTIFSSTRVFSNELALCIKWPKDWSFSLNISPSNECSGLISFRIDFQFYWDVIDIWHCRFKMYNIMIWHVYIMKWLP